MVSNVRHLISPSHNYTQMLCESFLAQDYKTKQFLNNLSLIYFVGKKRGASLRIAGVSVNAPSLLKHETVLEPLADAIPTDAEGRKK